MELNIKLGAQYSIRVSHTRDYVTIKRYDGKITLDWCEVDELQKVLSLLQKLNDEGDLSEDTNP